MSDSQTSADLSDIRARDAAAAPGPWHWAGNVDHPNTLSLCRWAPGQGRTTVLGTVAVERTSASISRASMEDVFGRDIDDVEWDETVGSYVDDPWTGSKRTDERLALNVEGLLSEMTEHAIFEVAPEATSRQDPKVYRGDIVGVRHPDAEFLAHARADVTALLAEVDRLTAAVEALTAENARLASGAAA